MLIFSRIRPSVLTLLFRRLLQNPFSGVFSFWFFSVGKLLVNSTCKGSILNTLWHYIYIYIYIYSSIILFNILTLYRHSLRYILRLCYVFDIRKATKHLYLSRNELHKLTPRVLHTASVSTVYSYSLLSLSLSLSLSLYPPAKLVISMPQFSLAMYLHLHHSLIIF